MEHYIEAFRSLPVDAGVLEPKLLRLQRACLAQRRRSKSLDDSQLVPEELLREEAGPSHQRGTLSLGGEVEGIEEVL